MSIIGTVGSRHVVVKFIPWRSLMFPRPPKAGDDDLFRLTDEGLAMEVRRGRQDALTVLYERYRALVFQIARRVLGDDGEAEDIVQDVLLGIYQRISHFDFQKGTFKSWVIRAARHRSIDRKRHLQSRGTYELLPLDASVVSDGHQSGRMAQLSEQESDQLIDELLSTLPPKEREVIELHFFRGLTLDEVRLEINESLSMVRRLYYGGLKKLQLGLSTRSHGAAGQGGGE
jgi:RNA polymerase sigma-70 factor (ECF subfamily)